MSEAHVREVAGAPSRLARGSRVQLRVLAALMIS